jgi:hypothetical protein
MEMIPMHFFFILFKLIPILQWHEKLSAVGQRERRHGFKLHGCCQNKPRLKL